MAARSTYRGVGRSAVGGRLRGFLRFLPVILLLSLATFAGSAESPNGGKPGHESTSRIKGGIPFDTYSGYFVSNKFEPKSAESFVVLTTQAEFDKVFGVGFVMGDKSHRLAKDAFQANLVLAAIKRGDRLWEFKVDSIRAVRGVVEVSYTTTSTKSDSATFACPLIVTIPKGKYTAVQFIENRKPAKRLEIRGKAD